MSIKIDIGETYMSISIDGDIDDEFQFNVQARCDEQGAYLDVRDENGEVAADYYEI